MIANAGTRTSSMTPDRVAAEEGPGALIEGLRGVFNIFQHRYLMKHKELWGIGRRYKRRGLMPTMKLYDILRGIIFIWWLAIRQFIC